MPQRMNRPGQLAHLAQGELLCLCHAADVINEDLINAHAALVAEALYHGVYAVVNIRKKLPRRRGAVPRTGATCALL